MKVLLISPDLFVKNIFEKIEQFILRAGIHGGNTPPLGLAYLASSARNLGHELHILDMRVQNKTEQEFENILLSLKPDVIGIYITTLNGKEVLQCARKIRSVLRTAKIIAGGPHLGLYPKETLEHNEFDYGLMCEADHTFPALLDAFCGKTKLEEISGLVYRKNGFITINGTPQVVENMNELPFPARDLLKGTYIYFGSHRSPFTTMVSSRGCPYNCSFCGKIPGSERVRFLSAERTVEEFEEIIRLGYKEVNFFDDLFTVKRDRVIKICNLIIQKKLDIAW